MSNEEISPAYLWFDTEFTSLDLNEARLLQVAMLITDVNLNRLSSPEQDVNLYISLGANDKVSDWVQQNLADLLAKCRTPQAVSIEHADQKLATLVDSVVGSANQSIKLRPILAGNTVHMDMAMAGKFLPELGKRLHYRMLDVSTMKILWNDWQQGPAFEKETTEQVRKYIPFDSAYLTGGEHDAYYDIHASIAELNYYRRLFCKS